MATTSFILGRNGTLGRPDGSDQKETHLKIAKLFKTNPMSSVETQIDDQIKRLDLEPFSDDDTSVYDSAEENCDAISKFALRKRLLQTGFKAWAGLVKAKN